MSATALLLIGSSKPGASASLTLGTALVERLAGHGYAVETIHVAGALKTEQATQTLLRHMEVAEIVILASPLYVDSLPAPVVRAFELFADRRLQLSAATAADGSQITATTKRPRFAALVNCGFPEPGQCSTALAICRLFAREVGFDWLGGLAFGMGGSIAGRPLERGPHARSAVPALDLAAAALARGDIIPPEATALAAKRAMPVLVYRAIANLGWRLQARGKTGGRSLKHRPYGAASARW